MPRGIIRVNTVIMFWYEFNETQMIVRIGRRCWVHIYIHIYESMQRWKGLIWVDCALIVRCFFLNSQRTSTHALTIMRWTCWLCVDVRWPPCVDCALIIFHALIARWCFLYALVARWYYQQFFALNIHFLAFPRLFTAGFLAAGFLAAFFGVFLAAGFLANGLFVAGFLAAFFCVFASVFFGCWLLCCLLQCFLGSWLLL